MTLGVGSDEAGEAALIQLCKLISHRLLTGRSVLDCGFHIEFQGGANDFEQRVLSAVSEAIGDVSKDQLFAILMTKVRTTLRREGRAVLTDNELPPGFSSN